MLIINLNNYLMSKKKRKWKKLNSQNFSGLVVANCNPVGLSGAPLYLIDFTLGGGVREYWILDGSWHLLNVPDKCLVIVAGCAYVTGGVRRPGDSINACSALNKQERLIRRNK